MRRGVLRSAINDWLTDNPIYDGGSNWWKKVVARGKEVDEIWRNSKLGGFKLLPPVIIGFLLYGLVYVFSGAPWAKMALLNMTSPPLTGDVSQELAKTIKGVFDSPYIRELAEITGTLITDPVVDIFEQYAGDDTRNPKEFARAFHGFMGGLTGGAGIASTLIEAASGGQIEGAGQMLMSMYWSLGLGFLGWQTLAPLLESGLQPGLKRYYQRLYRPARFSLSQVMDLYALGEMGSAQVYEEARNAGWREKDIALAIKLAFRQLTTGDITSLWQEGHITDAEAIKRLRALGFDPDDIPLLLKLNPKEDTKQARSVSLATAKEAYKRKLITESQFRGFLKELNYSETEVELQVQLAIQQTDQEQKILSASAIRQAWEENVLTDTEALHWLAQNGYGANEAGILLATWKAGSAPPFRMLNAGTITAAYVAGVINRNDAATKLKQVGFQEKDALLQLDLAEARNPEAFGKPAPARSMQLGPGTLEALLGARIIDAEAMKARLIEIGYGQADADALTQLAIKRTAKEPRPLTENVIVEAYVTGVLSRQAAQQRLEGLDIAAADAKLILDTAEAENPAVFNPDSVTSLRLPSVGAVTEALWAGIIGEDEFYRRMAELGYDRAGADIYRALAKTVAPVSSKKLAPTQIDDAYRKGFIPLSDAIQRLNENDYSNNEALLLLRLTSNVVKDMEPWKNMLAGLIVPEAAVDQLLGLGFTPDEIDTAFKEQEAAGG